MAGTGLNLQYYQSRILEYFNSGQHRMVRILSYPLLRGIENLDFQGVQLSLQKDLASEDCEL